MRLFRDVNDPDSRWWSFVRPVGMIAVFLTVWGLAVRFSHSELFPGPGSVARAIAELLQKGLLLQYIVASLFRVTWGFILAALVGIPVGLVLGWYARAFQAFNPLIRSFARSHPSPGFRTRFSGSVFPMPLLYFSFFSPAFSLSVFPRLPRCKICSKRYDLVVAGMVMIGLIGLMLDVLVRQLAKLDSVRWGYSK